MKLVTWNCQGAYRKKAEPIARFAPDIAVIQECEALERLIFPGNIAPPTTQLWFGDYTHKGVGIFSYTDLSFDLYENYDPTLKYCIPIKVTGHININLIAIWAMNHQERRLSYIGQVYRAVEKYRDFIRQADTILIGDFNSNKQWDKTPRIGNHSVVVETLTNEGLVSVYHEYFNEEQGKETRPTLFMSRKPASVYHVDYCFLPGKWRGNISNVSVGSYEEWGRLSDHSPLFIELDPT